MNTKRSYIESLNAGRPRREHATLEDLNRSLASLDERFSRNLQEAEQGSGEEDIAARMRRISEEISRRDAAAPAVRTGTDFVPDFERERARESGVASMSKIASELNTLREELRSRLENASAMAGAADPRPDFQFHPGQTPRASASDDHVIAGIVDRLEQIHAAVGNLPDSLSISSLEEKVKTLAAAVEHLARQKEMPGATTFDAIEERLDEISRAIVASAQPVPGFDNGHLERIEARIASLSRQLEELVEDRPADAVMKQLSALSARVEEIAGRAELPETSVDHLSRQIDLIVEKLEGGAKAVDPEVIFQGMEKRFETLTQALEQRHESAREQSVALFRDLEERLERYNQEALSTDAAIVEALNKRFSDLEEAVARRGSDPAALAGTLSQPAGRMPEFDDIGPRLELIERSVIESREAIIVAARAAAEHAVRSRDLPEGDAAVLSGLAEELGSLEKLARRSDERNSRTFEAIHDTLLQIVDRLADLESGAGSTSGAATGSVMKEAPARKLEFAEAPSLDMPSLGGMEEAEPLPQGLLEDEPRSAEAPPADIAGTMPKGEAVRDPKRSPAEAAAAAAMAALSNSETADRKSKPAPARSRLGKLSRVLSRKKGVNGEKDTVEERREPSAAAEPAGEAVPEVGLDQPLDPKLANQPLEPGSGAPDLNAIMRRVRDERGDEGRARDAEAAKSDFIAAARRAAQAAAAEAEVLKKKSDPEDNSGFSLKRLLRSNTKIVLLAAGVVLVGVAGTQLGKALLKEGGEGTVVAKATPAAAPQQTATKTETTAEAAAKSVAPEHLEAAAKPDTATEGDAMSPIVPLPAGQAPADTAATAKEPVPAGNDPAAASADVHAGSGAKPQAPMNVAAATAALPDHPSPSNDGPAEAADGANATAVASADTVDVSAETAAPIPAAQPDMAKDTAALEQDGAAAPATAMVVPNDAGPLPLREAAEKGDAKAMFEIGSRYAEGRGVASDMKIAAKWYEESAERGFAPAEYRIGNFYEKGIGVGRDIAKAKDWYTKAADLGNAAAMHNLGVLYAMGADGAVDNDAAVHWFEKAAQFGVKDSQFNLGILAAKGVGMKQNLEESYKWFALVAKTGDKDAAAKRDEVANSLRPEQLQKARATVELWKAKPVDTAANVVDIPDAWKESDTKTASIDMKQAVRNIQLILNKNGYDAGAADGIMGDKTKTAIAAFQKANGMQPTGEVNEALVTALLKKK